MTHFAKRNVKTPRRQLGLAGERMAVQWLRSQGYVIERTNARYPVGELDAIARDGDTLCFIEIRATHSLDWGGPLASIRAPKQRRIIRAAQWYLQSLKALPPEIRFDVVGIHWPADGKPALELIRGAFDADSALR